MSLHRDMSTIKFGLLQEKERENALIKWHAAKVAGVLPQSYAYTWLGTDVSEPPALDLRARQMTNN